MTASRIGYRPPPAANSVAWPEDFGQRFTLFVDTEEEFDWAAPLSREGHTVTATHAIPPAARRFADLGAGATWLVDYPIVTDAAAVDHLRTAIAQGRGAIGTQLHPWVNPPFDEVVIPRNSFAGNLPRALEAAKLDVLTAAITRAFGTAPTVYRAGRYGIGPDTIALLAARGYRFDTSIRARYDYRGEGGPDFRGCGDDAFHIGQGIVELPLTTVFIGTARRFGPPLFEVAGRLPRGRGVLARAGLLSRIALTPEDMPLSDALEAVRIAHGEGTRLLTLSCHSPSLVPGHTPYVHDAADLARLWAWLDGVLGLMARLGIADASIEQIDAAITRPLA